jgi:hypothetical protein
MPETLPGGEALSMSYIATVLLRTAVGKGEVFFVTDQGYRIANSIREQRPI